jgi:hydroxyethylthiazole kinase-like uncharacterized protein yjeF
MIKIASVDEMRCIEQAADAAGVSYDDMMQHAGRAVAEVVLMRAPEAKRVLALVGPGNNGGDALVAARVLAEANIEAVCYLLKPREEDDRVFASTVEAGVRIELADDDSRWRVLRRLLDEADVILDGLFGTGLQLPLRDSAQKLLSQAKGALAARLAESRCAAMHPLSPPPPRPSNSPLVIAVDCPSGLDSDTGEFDPVGIPADVTVTFAAVKRGQLIFPGAGAIGELIVADINVPEGLPELKEIRAELVTAEDVAEWLPSRPCDGHKGTFGKVIVVAGSVNYTGAAVLAGEAAYRSGVGLVTMAVPQLIYPILAAMLPEAVWLLLPHDVGVIKSDALEILLAELDQVDALVLGPGWGREEETLAFLQGLLSADHKGKRGTLGFLAREESHEGKDHAARGLPPLLIDADGLNLLAQIQDWPSMVPPNTILTPHPGEMARLCGLALDDIQANRMGIAAQYASEWHSVIVLKGAYTVIGSPDGRLAVMPFASDALASGGTGDVLAGCIGGLLAQGLDPFEAAVVGTYLHGLAGVLASQEIGNTRSVIAGDVLRALSSAITRVESR